MAAKMSVPCITTLPGVMAALRGIEAMRERAPEPNLETTVLDRGARDRGPPRRFDDGGQLTEPSHPDPHRLLVVDLPPAQRLPSRIGERPANCPAPEPDRADLDTNSSQCAHLHTPTQPSAAPSVQCIFSIQLMRSKHQLQELESLT